MIAKIFAENMVNRLDFRKQKEDDEIVANG
jgi:hypothetical protein